VKSFTTSFDTSLDESVMLVLKGLTLLYIGLSALLALVFAVIIVGVLVSSSVLKLAVRLIETYLVQRGPQRVGAILWTS
jgi:hypothetical protein